MARSRVAHRDLSVRAGGSVPYFDSVADAYFDRYREDSIGGHALRERKARVLELLEGVRGRVLDVGCGPGVMVQDLLDRGLEVWGLDAAPGMIEQCRERFGKTSRAHFVLGEATKLSFPDGFFDALISIGVLDRIQSCDLALAEMARVVKRGGTFLVSFPNLLSPYAVWKNFVFYPIVGLLRHAYYGLARRPIPQGPPLSFASLRTRRAAARLMAGHKVQVAEAVYFHFNLFLSPLDDLIRPLAVKVTGRFEGLRFGRMRWLGVGFILIARKH